MGIGASKFYLKSKNYLNSYVGAYLEEDGEIIDTATVTTIHVASNEATGVQLLDTYADGSTLVGNAIVLSHAHVDHYQSVGVIARRYNVPLYVSKEVYAQCASKIGCADIKHFSPKKTFKINTMKIKPITTSHDVPSTGFVISKFGLFTDTGIVTKQMQAVMKKLEGVLLESNHDIDMLLNCQYPYFLKQRILSDNGHLSNIHASEFVQNKSNGLSWVLLGHLSANSNTPNLAQTTFETIVKRKRYYAVCSREKSSGVWEL